MQIKTLIPVVLVAAGFWFWFAEEEQGPSEEEIRIQQNGKLIKDCINRQKSLNAAAIKAGDNDLTVDSKALCEEKYNVYNAEGQWHQLHTNDNDQWAPR